MLDLHTGPKATHYIYCAERQKESANKFLCDHVLLIPNQFDGAMEEACFMPWHYLECELKKTGRDISFDHESFTIELFNEETFSLREIENCYFGIKNYLTYKNVFSGSYKERI